jgi:hypothetical protein
MHYHVSSWIALWQFCDVFCRGMRSSSVTYMLKRATSGLEAKAVIHVGTLICLCTVELASAATTVITMSCCSVSYSAAVWHMACFK